MENKYNNSKVYKIEPISDHEEGDIYIGSTSNDYLSERMAEHRKSYRSWKKGVSKKTMVFDLFDKYDVKNCRIILLENVNVNSKDELKQKEAFHIKSNKCVNKMMPGRTTKQYYQDNKDYIANINKQYYEKNKEKMDKYHEEYRNKLENKERKKETDKLYREENKEAIKERKKKPFLCECGCTIQWDEKARHRRSQKHIKLMEQL